MAFSSVSPSPVSCCYNLGILSFTIYLCQPHFPPEHMPSSALCWRIAAAHCTRYALPLTVHYLPVGILFSGGRGLQLLLTQGLCYDLWSRRSCDTLFGDESLGFCDMTWWTSAMELSRGSAVQSFLFEVGHRDEDTKRPERERICSRLSTETRKSLLLVWCPAHSTRLPF